MSTNADFPVLLNVSMTETADHCKVKADITGFRAREVRVSSWEDSLVVEMQIDDDQQQNYYLGEVETQLCRRLIPLGFKINPEDVMTHYQSGKLEISVPKRIQSRSAA